MGDKKEEEDEIKELSKYEKADLDALCHQYAAYTRVNLAEEHGQIVTQIANMEEQLHTFSQLLEAISSSNSGIGGPEGLALAHLQWEKMQPGMARLDRFEELVAKVKEDMDKLEVQLEEAEATVDGGGGTLKQVSTVLKNPMSLFSKQGRDQASAPSPSPAFHPLEIFQASDYFPVAVDKQDGSSKVPPESDDRPSL